MSYTFAGILAFWLRHKEELSIFNTKTTILLCKPLQRQCSHTVKILLSFGLPVIYTQGLCATSHKACETLPAFKTLPNLRMPTKVVIQVRSNCIFLQFYEPNQTKIFKNEYSEASDPSSLNHQHQSFDMSTSLQQMACGPYFTRAFFKISYSSHIAACSTRQTTISNKVQLRIFSFYFE